MGSQQSEDWLEQDLDLLVELPYSYLAESQRYHQAGARWPRC